MELYGPDTWQTGFGQVTCWPDLGMSVCACVWKLYRPRNFTVLTIHHCTDDHLDWQPSFLSQMDNPCKPHQSSTISDREGHSPPSPGIRDGLDAKIIGWFDLCDATWLVRLHSYDSNMFCWSRYILMNSICSTCRVKCQLHPILKLCDCCSFRG